MSSENQTTRTRILEATVKLLESGNAEAVRMADIAKRAGISRQALYLHFQTRADLLVAATHHVDDLLGTNDRLAPSRAASTGTERLDAFITAWTAYIPEIYGVAKGLMALGETDQEAADAWNTRMVDMWEGCEAAILALDRDGQLSSVYPPDTASDVLWTMLSVRNWELLVRQRGWTQDQYAESMKITARRLFVAWADR